ncbi:hypothetical protein ACFYV7_34935 [Nocardia suismassiliense]|uniref:Thiolase C-terminal domain-containing protein n=1 Tax=Nocardia suismassiliense TaxID=2077092 RepID=A0ABW6R4K9_9NOCA
MSRRAVVAGVGMIPFTTPSRSQTYDVMGTQAARAALLNAGLGYERIQQAYAGYVYGDSTCGQAVLYGLGQTGIPVINVNNNCSTEQDMTKIVGYDMSKAAAQQVYEASGVSPEDIRVVELHDCFTANELLTYEALGLTPEGTAEKFVNDGDNTYGGRVVTNPSGGLLSKRHPLGATGLAQCAELVWQLRGQAEGRQVAADLKVALQHNIGLGGAAVVTLYEKVR